MLSMFLLAQASFYSLIVIVRITSGARGAGIKHETVSYKNTTMIKLIGYFYRGKT